jgi:hypothetical protein
MFKVSKFKNTKSLNIFIGKTLKKTQKELLLENGYNIKKCGFCDNDSLVKIDWKIENNEYVISNILYPSGYYCKQKSCPGKNINPQSKEWLSKVKGLTQNQINEYLAKKSKKASNTLKSSGWYKDISNNPFSKEFWIKKGYSETDAQNKVNERVGKSVNTMSNNGRYKDISNNPFSKEFWIKKGYSETDAQNKVNERNQFHPLFYNRRGYTMNDSIEMAKLASSTNSIDYYTKKYGYSIGNKKWNDRQKRWKGVYDIDRIAERYNVSIKKAAKIKEKILENWCNNFKKCKYSKSSFNLFKSIYDELPEDLKIKCYFGDNEFGKYDKKNNSYYFYDFVISNLNICFEYHGIKFHPKHKNKEWRQLFTNKSYDEVTLNDNNKRTLLETQGWDYYVIWEDEITFETKEEIISIILNKYYERV